MNVERFVGAGALVCETRLVKKRLAQYNGQTLSTTVSERST